MKVYVLHWQYQDKSGYGLIEIFSDLQKADHAHQLLNEHADGCGKSFYLEEMTISEYKATK